MKKNILILFFSFLFITSYSQDKKWVYLSGTGGYNDYSETSNLQIGVYKSKRSLPQGQEFTITIKNMSQLPRHVVGYLAARTVCFNDVTVNFDITIKPGETLGGKSYNFDNDGLTGTVLSSDCNKGKVYPNPNDTTNYEYDRINNVYIKIKTNEALTDRQIPQATTSTPKNNIDLNKSAQNDSRVQQNTGIDASNSDYKDDYRRYEDLKASREHQFGITIPEMGGGIPAGYNDYLKLSLEENGKLNSLEKQIEAAWKSKNGSVMYNLVTDYETECSFQKMNFKGMSDAIDNAKSSSSNSGSVSMNDVAGSVADFVSAASKIHRKSNRDFDDVDGGNWWFGFGGAKLANANNSFRNMGISGNLLMPWWGGDHFQFACELEYTFFLPADNNISAKILNLAPNTITNTKTGGTLAINAGWGPYLFKSENATLVLQPTIGCSAMGDYAVTYNDKEYTANDLIFGDRSMFIFNYGGYLRFYTRDLGFSLGYITNNSKEFNLASSYGNQLYGKLRVSSLNEAALKLTITYRLD